MHADGTIAYHVELTDGYELLRCQYNMDENGSFYVTPKRPIIKTKTEKKSLLSNTYDTLNEVMKSAYKTSMVPVQRLKHSIMELQKTEY